VTFIRALLQYLTLPYLLEGALITVEITAASFLGGLALGLIFAVMRESNFRVLRVVSWVYVWIFRGTPILLQLVFLYDMLPSWNIRFGSFVTAVIGFSLNEGAFMSELIRGGIHSVPQNQVLAAESLGMSSYRVLRQVVLPQAMRAMVPPFGNEAIGLLKNTSLASVIAVNELLLRAQSIVSVNFLYFEVLTASALMYLILTTVISIIQSSLEQRVSLTTDKRGWINHELATLKRRLMNPRGAIQRGTVVSRPTPAPADTLRAALESSSSTTVGGGTGAVPLLRADQGMLRPLSLPPSRIAAFLPRGWSGHQAPTDHATRQPDQAGFLVCRNVCKTYHSAQVLKGVSMTVSRGEVVVLMGPSGSGKSTLLRLIMHLEAVDDGEILLGQRHIGYERVGNKLRESRSVARARAEAGIGMVFQQFNLFEHLTALDNITAALRYVYRMRRPDAEKIGFQLLAKVGLSDYAHYLPRNLSGGQQQRVAIARALATDPCLILLDEPTSALDPELIGEVRTVIKGLANSGMTMLVSSHDVKFALEIADRIVFLQDGVIADEGPAHTILKDPKRAETRKFLQLIDA
jgi:polar amino acid transport system permease protein